MTGNYALHAGFGRRLAALFLLTGLLFILFSPSPASAATVCPLGERLYNGNCYKCSSGIPNDFLPPNDSRYCLVDGTTASFSNDFFCSGGAHQVGTSCYQCNAGSNTGYLINPSNPKQCFKCANSICTEIDVINASYVKEIGCSGNTFDGLNGKCYQCPSGYNHNSLLPVDAPGVCFSTTRADVVPPRVARQSCTGGLFTVQGNCADGLLCTAGECRNNPGLQGEICGVGDLCNSGLVCNFQRCRQPRTSRQSCEGLGQGTCAADLRCVANECRSDPGLVGEICGIGNGCGTGLVCNQSRCALPGAEGQPCEGTGQGTCDSFLVCNASAGNTCRVPVCGGSGEPICQSTPEGEQLCDPGLHPDFGICVADNTIAEPDCDCEPEYLAGDPAQPVRGYADLHLHLFSNLAFGGLTLWGEVFDDTLGVSGALRADNYAQRTSDYVLNGHVEQGINSDVVPIDLFRAQQLVHGDLHINDIVGFGTGQNNPLPVPTPSLENGGVEWEGPPDAENFVGWPRWNSTTHQQAYYTWLQRAHRGGLQLAVMMAVNNEVLCISGRRLDYPEFACDDGMRGIDLQLDKAEEFEKWLDDQCAAAQVSGSPSRIERHCARPHSNRGWFEVVRTPADARAAIANGQLAVVLAIEEANVFDMAKGNCKVGNAACESAYLQQQLKKYYDKGVRHVFPIHNFDNPFGGAATWQNTIAVGNRFINNEWFATENCPLTPGEVGGEGSGNGYGYTLDLGVGEWLSNYVLQISPLFLIPPDYYKDLSTMCNSRGLTPLGEELVVEMMRRGMIIDIDHMSNRSLDKTLELAQQKKYPGIVASHALMFELTKKDYRHERMRTRKQLEDIAELGGMIGVMTQPSEGADNGVLVPVTVLQKPGSIVINDCQASSKTFAHALEWATEVMTVNGKRAPIAFGTDFNGISRHNAPRFGIDACDGQLSSNLLQADPVQYPFIMPGFGTFHRQETGGQVFDYNLKGLAHIGLLPDMIQDMKKVGLTDDDLEPLFESAEAYIAMWEKSLAVASSSDFDETCGDAGQPVCLPPVVPACDSGLFEHAAEGICRVNPPVEPGDFNADACVDLGDLNILMADLRDGDSSNDDPAHDLNGDGLLNVYDARKLVLLFTNPRGAPCD